MSHSMSTFSICYLYIYELYVEVVSAYYYYKCMSLKYGWRRASLAEIL
jgi:hypothetical protein